MNLLNGLKYISGIFLPNNCVVCGKEIETAGAYLCKDCKKDIPYIQSVYCIKCGRPFALKKGISHLCMDCIEGKNKFILSRAVFEYHGSVAKLIQKYKFNDMVNLSSFFVNELFDLYKRAFADQGIEAVIPVPLSKKRLKRRSYNQTQLLAGGLSKKLGISYYSDVLEKIKETPAQSTLKADARRRNVKHAYRVVNKRMLSGKSILLLDDVITTGATINACVSALRRARIKRIYVMAIAMRA